MKRLILVAVAILLGVLPVGGFAGAKGVDACKYGDFTLTVEGPIENFFGEDMPMSSNFLYFVCSVDTKNAQIPGDVSLKIVAEWEFYNINPEVFKIPYYKQSSVIIIDPNKVQNLYKMTTCLSTASLYGGLDQSKKPTFRVNVSLREDNKDVCQIGSLEKEFLILPPKILIDGLYAYKTSKKLGVVANFLLEPDANIANLRYKVFASIMTDPKKGQVCGDNSAVLSDGKKEYKIEDLPDQEVLIKDFDIPEKFIKETKRFLVCILVYDSTKVENGFNYKDYKSFYLNK